MTDFQSPDPRRPIATRSQRWAQRLAGALARSWVTPNQISLVSILFAAIGAVALWRCPMPWGGVICAGAIQLRLLCNMLDGMVAVEGGKKSDLGALYNEVPDRIADSCFIVALGYAAGEGWLGWAGALAAALTAYIRTLGGAMGLAQDFRGPMAKPHRMATMTLACLLAAAETPLYGTSYALLGAAILILAGALLTCATRLAAIARLVRRR